MLDLNSSMMKSVLHRLFSNFMRNLAQAESGNYKCHKLIQFILVLIIGISWEMKVEQQFVLVLPNDIRLVYLSWMEQQHHAEIDTIEDTPSER